ncbi:MAG TPA: 16S rRNA (guanine(527)-N(7))-methyltransferase RsmG [Bacteroidales bacterium]|nr:16S rRNA (guanine(527)-N(7))-methyltransferase RsmG [Bacteroidales bacterium]
MEIIRKYFPSLPQSAYSPLAALHGLYSEWNARINVISRKDMENFEERHVLHSLAIAKIIQFEAGTRILDVGTGGGFPGIPLAIIFPDCEFVLVDSIGKKIKVVNEIKNALGLNNVTAIQSRAEELNHPFDFVVSRAVTSLPEFVSWIANKIDKNHRNALENGVLYLKGGDIRPELQTLKAWRCNIYDLDRLYDEEFFTTKKLVHLYK